MWFLWKKKMVGAFVMLTERDRKIIESGEYEDGVCVGCGNTIEGLSASDITVYFDETKSTKKELCRICTMKICEGKLKDG